MNPGKIDELIVILDSEEYNEQERKKQVENIIKEYIEKKNCAVDFSYKVFVCNHCFETWLLGNGNLYPDIRPEGDFQPYYDKYNIKVNDPELMAVPDDIKETIAVYHFHYLHEMCRYNRVRYSKKKRLYISEAGKILPFTAMTLTRAVRQLEATDLFIVAKDGVNKIIESKYNRYELFEKSKVYLSTPVRNAGYIDKTQVTEDMVFAGETALSEKTMLNPNRVVTYAISEKDYDTTLLTEELIDPDKQVRLELWAYDPKYYSENNSADDISVILSFENTNDERIEEAVDELLERRLRE